MRRLAALLLLAPLPAQAQIFWQAPDFTGAPITPGEVGIGVPLPGATDEENRANIAWQLRAGLNVAALQCQFDQTLMSGSVYNAVLTNHREELAKTYQTLANYFKRTSKTPREGQQALDRYGTKTYSSLSAVQGILPFCETASRIGQSAVLAPRGSFTAVAIERLRELRNSQVARVSDQLFRRPAPYVRTLLPVSYENKCWSKTSYKARCGFTSV